MCFALVPRAVQSDWAPLAPLARHLASILHKTAQVLTGAQLTRRNKFEKVKKDFTILMSMAGYHNSAPLSGIGAINGIVPGLFPSYPGIVAAQAAQSGNLTSIEKIAGK